MEKIEIKYPKETTNYIFIRDGLYFNGTVKTNQVMTSIGKDLETFTDYAIYIDRLNELSIPLNEDLI